VLIGYDRVSRIRSDNMWAIYYTKDGITPDRVKVKADDFDGAMAMARELIPAGARITDCEPVGIK